MGIFSGISNAISGRKTRKEGEKLYSQGLDERQSTLDSRQNYDLPQEVLDAYGLAKANANVSQAQQGMERVAERTQASNLGAVRRYATSGADALAAAAGVNNQTAQELDQAQVVGAQEKLRNRAMLYDQASQIGQFRNLQYELNVQQPYLQRLQFANDKVGAGLNMKLAGRQQAAAGWGQIGDSVADIAVTAATGGLGGGGGLFSAAGGGGGPSSAGGYSGSNAGWSPSDNINFTNGPR